jgi:hypothetical protein
MAEGLSHELAHRKDPQGSIACKDDAPEKNGKMYQR